MSTYMTPDAIMQLQQQEAQRAHEVQRRAIEKSFMEKAANQEIVSRDVRKP